MHTLKIIPREEWGARQARKRVEIKLPTPRLWLHHSAGNERGAAGVRAIQKYHMDTRGWADIGYSFLVDPDDGLVYEGRGVGVAGAHTEGDNSGSHGICALGNYEVDQPTHELLESLRYLVALGQDRRWWLGLAGGHRDAPHAATACPGRNLYKALGYLRNRPPKEDVAMAVHDDVWNTLIGNDQLKAPARNLLWDARVLADSAVKQAQANAGKIAVMEKKLDEVLALLRKVT